jgi:hypothetical protein
MSELWTTIAEAPWRVYPAAALAALGVALVVRGLWSGAAGQRGLLRQGRDAFAWIRCFQYAVGGLALVAIAIAWNWQQPWLLILALGIVGEEMLETSRILTALNNDPKRQRAARRVSRRAAATG